jgi:hypothetical protein
VGVAVDKTGDGCLTLEIDHPGRASDVWFDLLGGSHSDDAIARDREGLGGRGNIF